VQVADLRSGQAQPESLDQGADVGGDRLAVLGDLASGGEPQRQRDQASQQRRLPGGQGRFGLGRHRHGREHGHHVRHALGAWQQVPAVDRLLAGSQSRDLARPSGELRGEQGWLFRQQVLQHNSALAGGRLVEPAHPRIHRGVVVQGDAVGDHGLVEGLGHPEAGPVGHRRGKAARVLGQFLPQVSRGGAARVQPAGPVQED
jgi:hypothetical protein